MKSLVGMALLLVLAATGLSATWYVASPPDGSDSNDGTSGWDQAFATISNAVAKADHGHTILVTNGDYALTASLTITKTIDLRSVNGPSDTAIDGNDLYRCVYFNNSTVGSSTNTKIQGFRLKRGQGASGSGAYISGRGATVHNCIVEYCSLTTTAFAIDIQASEGAQVSETRIANNKSAVYIRYAPNVTVRDCTIASNVGYSIRVYDIAPTNRRFENCTVTYNTNNNFGSANLSGPTVFTNCLFAYNTCPRGGGIYTDAGTGLFWDCTIASNRSTSEGGGLYVGAPSDFVNCRIVGNTGGVGSGGVNILVDGITLSNCWILNNYGAQGGGLSDSQPTRLYNCLIAGNSSGTNANNRGGGVHFSSTTKTGQYWNCTIVSNVALGSDGLGGGLYYGGGVHMVNCILYDNAGGEGRSNWYRNSGTLFITNTCTAPTSGAGIEGANNTAEPPVWVNPAAGDFRLGAGSPCINAGLMANWMAGTRDLDGRARLDRFSRQVDMGAYEAVPVGTLFQLR